MVGAQILRMEEQRLQKWFADMPTTKAYEEGRESKLPTELTLWTRYVTLAAYQIGGFSLTLGKLGFKELRPNRKTTGRERRTLKELTMNIEQGKDIILESMTGNGWRQLNLLTVELWVVHWMLVAVELTKLLETCCKCDCLVNKQHFLLNRFLFEEL